jgi:hypothetical protein
MVKKMTIEKAEKERAKFERRFAQKFVNAQRDQINSVIKILRKDQNPYYVLHNIATLIRPEPFENALIDLYIQVSRHFGRLAVGELMDAKQKKDWDFNFGSTFWLEKVSQFIRKTAAQKITWMTETTREFVLSNTQQVIDEGYKEGLSVQNMAKNLIKQYQTKFPDFAQYRAERISRTEIVNASNWGSYTTAQTITSFDIKKIWISAADTRTRESHLNVKGVDLNGKFSIEAIFNPSTGRMIAPAAELDYPGDPTGPPGQIINCRCAIGYERED